MMKLTFAFALNNDGLFENKHFGEADKFALYHEENKSLVFNEYIINPTKEFDEKTSHGSLAKGNAVIGLLKEKNVNVLISRKFGQNINRVNSHFIPVIIHENSPETVVPILDKHKKWFKDELKNRNGEYALFQVKSGILKSRITTNPK
ncbi:NifB/NifX family molybdenum-iron cluster-binding protein [uncultured Draconibacterium sp.]|uniref:NifB/NifX family molybdenum-iron cluster-binding protein n=1 Tax=uncultured Draconibacterium sp. TaxID=1573823 RepID=UPI003216BDA4